MEEFSRPQMSEQHDHLSEKLLSASHLVLTVIFGLLPLVFIPVVSVGLAYTKIFFAIAGIAVALIFFSLSVLRSGSVTLHVPRALFALWLVLLFTAVSALLSGDLHDALIGNTLGIHTAAFVGLLAISTTVWVLIGIRKENVMRLYMLFALSTLVLVVYHLLRIIFGADFLSFGIFTNTTSTPIGGWNDLALFLGLTILLSIVTFEQLPLTKWGRLFFGFVVAVALMMLAIINFSFVWVVLGIVSLVMVIYIVSKGKKVTGSLNIFTPDRIETSIISLSLPLVVFVVSTLFILSGPFFGNLVSETTGISYIEVRPSVSATADVARGVYSDQILLGIGPNKFVDAWRLYKDASINETVFWNVDFESGIGYIPTFFVTTGILGGVAWILFLGLFVVFGVRMLFRANDRDRMWYFIGTSAFVGAAFIWGMAFVYVPGSTILLIGALCTGLTFVAEGALMQWHTRTLSLTATRQGSFFTTLAVVIVVIASVGTFYGVGRHLTSTYLFSESVRLTQEGGQLEEVERLLVNAYALSNNDRFMRRLAEYQLARMTALLAVVEPSEDLQQQFQDAVSTGISAARLAVDKDNSDPENRAVLGRIYAVLASVGIEQSYELGSQAFRHAQELDPKNPLRTLELAQLEARAGNTNLARSLVLEAIGKKSNYGDALYFLSQLDIAEGNVASAVETTRAVISLEPNNPTRYYQLGILESSRRQFEPAAAAFERAVQLSPAYANARYFLALTYSELERPNDAAAELQVVLELNPGNELVINLLDELRTTGRIQSGFSETEEQPVHEEEEVSQAEDDVTTTGAPDTPLVTPVNTPAESGADVEEEAANPEPQETIGAEL